MDEANRQIPIPKDGFTFETLIKSRDEVEYFKEFLSNKHTRGKITVPFSSLLDAIKHHNMPRPD